MGQCSNCFGGCHDIVSDKCIRYTGIDVSILGIQTGDSLSFVEQALVTFLVSTLDGTGIKLDIDEDIICELVSQYLPNCEDISALNMFKALIQAACSLQEQIDAVVADVATIEADYDVDCLEGVVAGDGTHAVLQTVITKLCETDEALAALALDLDTNYVKLADLNDLIQAYLDSIAIEDKYYKRMVPYCPIPYVGSLTGFDITGAGSGVWEQVYLCNGNNSTPDLRGRVTVGAIVNMGGGVMSPQVDPGVSSFNPNYALNDYIYGNNSVTLTEAEFPSHTHVINDPEHFHYIAKDTQVTGGAPVISDSNYTAYQGRDGSTDENYDLLGTATEANVGKTSSDPTGVSAEQTGGGDPHDNKQPSWATYFLIHIPD